MDARSSPKIHGIYHAYICTCRKAGLPKAEQLLLCGARKKSKRSWNDPALYMQEALFCRSLRLTRNPQNVQRQQRTNHETAEPQMRAGKLVQLMIKINNR